MMSVQSRRSLRWLAFPFFFLSVSSIFAQLAPGTGDWRTHTTPHFLIHYQAADQELAHRMAGLAERVHARLEPKYRTGASQTHIVLVTATDLVNSFATPVGLDRIFIFTEHPRPGEFSRFDLWMETLITHEYTHIVTLRYYDSPLLYTFRILFGVPPNMLGPIGLQEGYAVFEESQKGLGRLHDPLTNMIVRTAVLEDSFPSAAEAMAGSHRWPHGQIVYLYGALTAEQLHKIAPDKAAKFWREDTPSIFLDSKLLSLGYPYYYRLYRQMTAEKTEQMRAEIESLRQKQLTQVELLTQDGEYKEHLTEGDTGLLYFARSGTRASGIFRLVPGQEPERVRLAYSLEGVTERNGRILASEDYFFYPGLGIRQELQDADRVFFSRMLPDRSIVDPLIAPDGKTLYYIEKFEKERRLVRASLSADSVENESILYRVPVTGILRYPALSPDGKKLAVVARKEETGMGVLLLCSDQAADCKTLAAGPSVKAHPRFSKDGRLVYFASDADGIYNIYSADLATGEITKRTRTLTGLFDPVPAADALYAFSYSGRGYDLARIRYDDLISEKSDLFAGHTGGESLFEAETETPADPAARNWPEDPSYAGVLGIRPFFSGLLGSSNAFSLGFMAFDPMEWHTIAAGVSTGVPDPYGFAMYDYSRFVVNLSLFYQTNYWKRDRAPGCLIPDDPLRFICEDGYAFTESMGAYLRYINEGRYLSLQVMPGYISQKIRNARAIRTEVFDARDLNLTGPSFAFALGRTEYFPESVSPERGFMLFAMTDYYLKSVSRDELDPRYSRPVDFGAAEGGLALYLPSFFDHHVNYFSAYASTTYGPDRMLEQSRLSHIERGIAYDRSPTGPTSVVYTYEYRLPIHWWSVSPSSMPELMLRNVGMSVFAETGASFDKLPYRRDYKSSAGLNFQFGISALYLPFAPFQLTLAHGFGKEGEFQVYLGFQTSFGPGSEDNQNFPRDSALKPWHRPLPRATEMPGYFHSAQTGGILN